MYYDENKLYTTIATITDPHADYSFDDFWVIRDANVPRVFYQTDSGCSCPSPFENDWYKGPDDTSFTEVTKTNFDQFVAEIMGHCGNDDLDEKRAAVLVVKELLGV